MALPLLRRRLLAASAIAAGGIAASGLQGARAAAPFRRAQAPGFYRIALGSFELTVLSDGPLRLSPAHPTFGGNASEAEVLGALRAARLPTDSLPAECNTLLVNTGRELVLLDTGTGPAKPFGPTTDRLLDSLRAAGHAPEEIDVVAISHLHPDHAWGVVGANGAPRFPRARYVVTAPDFDFWTAERNVSLPAPLGGMVAGTRERLLPLAERTTMLNPGQPVLPGITSVPAPGHTGGHVCFLIESDGQRLIYTADTANHWLLALMRPDWHFSFDANPGLAEQSRRRIFGQAATDQVRVLAYHFPWPGLGRVEVAGQGFRWLPEPWSWS